MCCVSTSARNKYQPISLRGCLTPISLLTAMMEIRDVSGRMAASRILEGGGGREGEGGKEERGRREKGGRKGGGRGRERGREGRGVGRSDKKESWSCTSQSYIEVHNAIFLHREVGNFKSLILHCATRVQNTLVLLQTRNIDLPFALPSLSSTPFIFYGNASSLARW